MTERPVDPDKVGRIVLAGSGPGEPAEWVKKTEFDALARELAKARAELAPLRGLRVLADDLAKAWDDWDGNPDNLAPLGRAHRSLFEHLHALGRPATAHRAICAKCGRDWDPQNGCVKWDAEVRWFAEIEIGGEVLPAPATETAAVEHLVSHHGYTTNLAIELVSAIGRHNVLDHDGHRGGHVHASEQDGTFTEPQVRPEPENDIELRAHLTTYAPWGHGLHGDQVAELGPSGRRSRHNDHHESYDNTPNILGHVHDEVR